MEYDLVLPAPAKLNLFLHITGRREDGYHLLQTLFQIVNHGDEVGLRLRDDDRVHRVNAVQGVPAAQDLSVRAAKALQRQSGVCGGVDIHVTKRLPVGGGLGGGSSDAATVLIGLNKLWKLGYSLPQLAAIGLRLGADIPVFVRGQSCWAEGIGEQTTALQLPQPWFVVLTPDVRVCTRKLFSHPGLTRSCLPIKIRDLDMGRTGNVFEPLVREMYPEVERAFECLGRYGEARLTGTGACVFAAFDTRERADEVHSQCAELIAGFVAQGVNRSPLHAKI